jgi:hypothetical protein
MNKFAVISVLAVAGSAFAGTSASINSMQSAGRIFNDRPDSTLVIANNYPSSVQITETNFGPGGFANRHAAWLSNDGGASAFDFNYEDGWQFSTTVTHLASSNVTVEAGIHSDLFGLGFFGQLPNGEIVSFGSVLPFFSFGVQPFSQSISLRITHFPGTGDGVNPLPSGGSTSKIYYEYNLGGGWVSSPAISWNTGEGGLPSGNPESQFILKLGVGAQHNAAAEDGAVADTLFSNITFVPTPGAAALLGLAGLAGLRRRRA